MPLFPGLYEQIVNHAVQSELEKIPDAKKQIAVIDTAEASKVLSQYAAEIIRRGLDVLAEGEEAAANQVDLINKIIALVERVAQSKNLEGCRIEEHARQLLALLGDNDAFLDVKKIPRPETSIAQSSLFTGAVCEPQMYSELKKEIASADRIDMLVSFIKWSGLRLILDDLRTFTKKGGNLRIITTSYMGATDIKAVKELSELSNTQIKLSYDTKRTRLHAKTYVFYRNTGFTTAYVGSSNLSNAAISSGLEWNVKVTRKDLPETIDKIEASFESYWNSKDFETFTNDQTERLSRALKAERYCCDHDDVRYTVDVNPYSYQQEILDKLEAERKIFGYTKNLIVAATGTGKTVVSALDYKRFRAKKPNASNRLLFIAHREEILKQSLATFRAVLKDANFGEMFVGGHKPESAENLFMSVQTFNSQNFVQKTAPDFYDYIVIDEFHHAAAPTYQKLLSHYTPKILLGLTATPERMDGQSILPYFNNRVAAEIRLPEAIERKLLCPFQYFGVADVVDLDKLRWSRGGYDKNELENVYSLNAAVAENRADLIVRSILKYTANIDDVKGLGFCVSVRHAEFMANYFNAHKIPSMYLTGDTESAERSLAKSRLENGEIKFIFVVDIYNEGVDIPAVNTILFLRPTESLTIFLQQLGRGLRLYDNKDCLTVLDFIGQANKKYNFESKFAALLNNANHNVKREIENGFVSVPKGCYIQLEKVAAQHVLDNIRSAYSGASGLISLIADFAKDSGNTLTLGNFLDYYRLDPRTIYKYSTFSRLSVKARVKKDFSDPLENVMTKALKRLSVVNSRRWIAFLLDILPQLNKTNFNSLTEIQKKMLQMFCITVWDQNTQTWDNLKTLHQSPVMLAELMDLLRYQLSKIDFVDEPVNLDFECPLDLHCVYTRDQILTALDVSNPSTVREGVKWLPKKQLDILFVTLNKSDKDYSPTTMYNDYSINEKLFHWQSQSTTSEKSKTGQRYIHHAKNNSKVLLFVREFKNDALSNIAEAYTFLGTANYVSHTGSNPMNITWCLDKPIPAKFLKKTNKLAVI